jgi:4-hydroxybenzoate polyprenyltransferase
VILPLGGAIALAVYALVATGDVSLPLCLSAFLFIYASYRIDHLAEVNRFDETLSSARSRALAQKGLQIGLAITAFVAALAMTWMFSGWHSAALLLVFPVAVAFYGTPLLNKITAGRLGATRIKNIPQLKALYTSFFWALLFVFGSVFLRVPQDGVLFFFFGWMWMRLFAITVFCDCKDVERDRAEGVSTFVLRLGLPRTLRLLGFVNVLSLVWLAIFVVAQVLPLWVLPLGLVGFYTRLQLQRMTQPNVDVEYLCDVMMDGEFIWWLPCVLPGWGLAQFL